MLTPLLVERVSRLYDAHGEEGCPGENECPIFQSSADDQPPEARCPSCPKRRPATEESGGPPSAVDGQLIDQVERLVNERDSGFGFPDDLTPLEKELVIIWDQCVGEYERAHQVKINAMFEAMMQMATPKA